MRATEISHAKDRIRSIIAEAMDQRFPPKAFSRIFWSQCLYNLLKKLGCDKEINQSGFVWVGPISIDWAWNE